MSTASANATTLPAFYPSICPPPTPRRGFLAGLASLPLFGGNAAFSGLSGKAPEPDDDRPATFEDYLAAEFDALEIDMDAARQAHRNMWTTLAIGLKLLTKTPDECCEFAKAIGDEEDAAKALVSSLKDGAEWFRQAAGLIESAEARYLCGAARFVREEGLDA